MEFAFFATALIAFVAGFLVAQITRRSTRKGREADLQREVSALEARLKKAEATSKTVRSDLATAKEYGRNVVAALDAATEEILTKDDQMVALQKKVARLEARLQAKK